MVILVDENGKMAGVYSDTARGLFELGDMEVHRVSDVTFNPTTLLWDVVINGKTILSDRNRDTAVNREVKYITERLEKFCGTNRV